MSAFGVDIANGTSKLIFGFGVEIANRKSRCTSVLETKSQIGNRPLCSDLESKSQFGNRNLCSIWGIIHDLGSHLTDAEAPTVKALCWDNLRICWLRPWFPLSTVGPASYGQGYKGSKLGLDQKHNRLLRK